MHPARTAHLVGLAAILVYFRCTVGDPGAFAPVDAPTIHHFPLATIEPDARDASVAVAVYPDGYVVADGVMSGGPPGQAYVLHFHRGDCGSVAVAFPSGPAVSRVAGPGAVVTEFPQVPVSIALLHGGYSADVHRVGESAVLACGVLR